VKKKRSAEDRTVDARRLHAALRLVQLEAAQILRRRRIGRAADEGRERPHLANVVAVRLLGEAAHHHVFDHARTQRADGPGRRSGGHRGDPLRAEGCWTFDARDRMPRSSLALALREIGRIERTLFMLDWLELPGLRRQATVELNKGEARNALARAVCFHRLGRLRDRAVEAQQYRASGLALVTRPLSRSGTPYISTVRSMTCVAAAK